MATSAPLGEPRRLAVTTSGRRSVTEAGSVVWTGPPSLYRGILQSASSGGLTLALTAGGTIRIPAGRVLSVADEE